MDSKQEFCKVKHSEIAKLIRAAGNRSADLLYASGFPTADDYLFAEFGGKRLIVLSPLEIDRGRREAAPGVEVLCDTEFSSSDGAAVVRELAARFGAEGFLVPADFPLGFAEELRRAGISVTPAGEGSFFPEREFKRESEVEKIAEALRAAEAGTRRGIEVLRESSPGAGGVLFRRGEVLTSEILRGEIEAELLRRGAMPAEGTIAAGALQGAQPHNAGSGPLYADTPIVMDVFPRSVATGYWGDLTRTVVRGTASPTVARAFEAVLEARELGKRLLRRGAIPAEIHAAAADLLASRGFPTGTGERGRHGFFHGLGHGVGLEIHEAPRLSPRNAEPLRGGEVVTVEPGLYYPEWGGIRLEDMAYVTSGGCRVLTEIGTPFEI